VETSADRVVVGATNECAGIAEIAFTSEDRVREVIHNFNSDGFDSLAPKYSDGRPAKFTLPERREIKKIALATRARQPRERCLTRH
jgi:transposase